MNDVIGTIVPLSMGVALSPFPIIMIVLLLGSARPRANGLAFLATWVLGLAAIAAALTFTMDALDSAGTDPTPVAGVLRIVLGAGLLFLAAHKFIKRFVRNDAGPLPRWMAAAGSYSPGRSALMGLMLSAVNPKNIGLSAAAGATIGAASLTVQAELWAMAAFILLASATVIVPVAAYLVAPRKIAVPLQAVMEWLQTNHSVMTGMLLVVFGFVLVGNGIGSF